VSLIKNTILFSLGLSLVFLVIFFSRNTYIPANGYKPAVLLDKEGDPISLRIKDKPVVVLTGWGTPEGFNKAYDDYLYWRTSGGERITSPTQACTQWHVGSFPFQVEISRLPFAVGRKVKGMERLWDSVGAYRISEDNKSYIPIVENKAGEFPYAGGDAEILYQKDLEGIEVIAMKDYVSASASRDTGGFPLIRYTPDPRNGNDYLEGIFLIKKSNGVNDYYEIDKAYKARVAGMMGWDLNEPAYYPEYDKVEAPQDPFIENWIGEYFDDQILVREGYYSNVPGLTNHLKDTMPRMARNGYRKIVLAKPITDHNIYANNFWDLNLSSQSLCRAGFNVNDFDINQVRMYGRTPEYNYMMHNNLQRHLDHIEPSSEVAVIYTTFGLPWPGDNPVGPMSNAAPFIQEVFHENAYLNFLSYKRYIEQNEKEHKISFYKTGGSGSPDARTNNLFAYALFSGKQLGYPEDPLRYINLRETIEDTILNQKKKEVIIQLSHWGYSYWVLIINMREALNIPLNSIEEIHQGELRMTWCEKHHAPGDYEQVPAVNHQCPEGFSRIQLMEAFEDFVDDMAVNYVNRIRGGIERLQIYPNLGITIAAEGQITKLNGGIVEVNSGALAGAKIAINADPNPKKPISYTWDNRWRPESDRNPNTGSDAVRAINEYDQISDYLDSSKDDLIIVIGTQEKASPREKMPIHPNAISKTVFFGPHRTIFNVPVLITIPYDQEKLKNPANIKPLVFNEITQSFDIHPKVRRNYNNQLDTTHGTFTFETQILGQFMLAEISD
tara:strand:+ start:197 stop:2539 length:2343 start_codon:yes stop_codon:yes gene_type:complete